LHTISGSAKYSSTLPKSPKKTLSSQEKETIKMFARVDGEIGERLEKALGDSLGMKDTDHVSQKYGLQTPLGGGY
jgi:catalase